MTDSTAGPQWRVARLPEVFGAGTKGPENAAIRLFVDEDVASCNAWMQHLVVAWAEIYAGTTPAGTPIQGFNPLGSETARGRVATRRGAGVRVQAFGFSRDRRGRCGNRVTFGWGGTP
jgi:hypothetical protein